MRAWLRAALWKRGKSGRAEIICRKISANHSPAAAVACAENLSCRWCDVFGLPPKALSVLIDLKKELLSPKETPQMEASRQVEHKKEKQRREKRKQFIRHARPPNAFQRMCHRRDFASPIYCFLIVATAAILAVTGFAQSANRHPYRIHPGTGVLLNNLALTPGSVRTIDKRQVCEGGSTKQFRHTTEAMKREVYALYGVDKSKTLVPEKNAVPPLYEIDHLISLELGGADEVENLWPQPYYQHPGAHEKDRLENEFHKMVCAGRMDLMEAQREIATDWYAAYLKTFKTLPASAKAAKLHVF
jgi:hypothetical protein